MPELQVIARHRMKAGVEGEVLPVVAELVRAARTEPGNLAFDAYRDTEDARSYVLLERYVSREAFAAHRETPHFKDLMLGRILPLLAGRTLETYDVVDEQP